MPSFFCCKRSWAAFCQSAGVDCAGWTPLINNAALPISWASANIPTLPLNLGFHRSFQLGLPGVRRSFWGSMYFVLMPIPVNPDCHASEFLFPGSYHWSTTSFEAYLLKLGIAFWSMGMT